MIVSSAERKSLPILEEHFDFELGYLEVADIQFPTKKIMAELKFGDDVHDYRRLEDELTRMNYPKYADWEKHAIYIDKVDNHSFFEYRRFVAICLKHGVYPHHVPSNFYLVKKIKEIRSGKYSKEMQYHKRPSKELTDFQRVLALMNGITENKAVELSECNSLDEINTVFGPKKDGSPKKIFHDFIKFLEGIKNNINKILGQKIDPYRWW